MRRQEASGRAMAGEWAKLAAACQASLRTSQGAGRMDQQQGRELSARASIIQIRNFKIYLTLPRLKKALKND